MIFASSEINSVRREKADFRGRQLSVSLVFFHHCDVDHFTVDPKQSVGTHIEPCPETRLSRLLSDQRDEPLYEADGGKLFGHGPFDSRKSNQSRETALYATG